MAQWLGPRGGRVVGVKGRRGLVSREMVGWIQPIGGGLAGVQGGGVVGTHSLNLFYYLLNIFTEYIHLNHI